MESPVFFFAVATVVLVAGIVYLVVNTFRLQAQLETFAQNIQKVNNIGKRLALEKDLLTLENAVNATRAQVIGGIVVFFTAFTAWRNLKVAEEKQVTERFSKAVEQLGHDNVHVRLGAIYALERIANDSDKDYWQVMEILTAYVRERSPWSEECEESNRNEQQSEVPPLKIDIQAVLTVLNRRKHTLGHGESHPLDLSGTDLRRANLQCARMQGVLLVKSHLEDANLKNAYLDRADLNGSHLERAYLSCAHLKDAQLNGSYLEDAQLNDAHLENAKLFASHLEGTNLYKANLRGADLGATHLANADLRFAHLEGANLKEAQDLDPRRLMGSTSNERTTYPNYLQEFQRSASQHQ
jgi:Pentapeptide repeats (8 copies)